MRKVSNKELEKLNIHHLGYKVYPNKYYFEVLDEEINIPEYYSINDILKIIYDRGYEIGLKKGKAIRSQEFKNLLEDESTV